LVSNCAQIWNRIASSPPTLPQLPGPLEAEKAAAAEYHPAKVIVDETQADEDLATHPLNDGVKGKVHHGRHDSRDYSCPVRGAHPINVVGEADMQEKLQWWTGGGGGEDGLMQIALENPADKQLTFPAALWTKMFS
jgi:hypothetical protein